MRLRRVDLLRRIVTPCVGLLFVAGCSEPPPEVEVNTFVGDSFARSDPQLRRETALQVLETALPELLGQLDTQGASSKSNLPDTVHPPKTPAELEDLVNAIRKGPIDELAGPAHRIAKADPALWPEVREMMLRGRKAPKGDYRSLLAAIGGDLPNRYGHFARAWKKAHGHKVKLSHNWFDDLLSLPRSKVSPGLTKVYRDCVLQAALLRAASHVGQTPALAGEVVDGLLRAAYVHRGTFRDEVGRAIVAVGDEAIPHLVLTSMDGSTRGRDQEKPEVQRGNYAKFNLDRMDRLHPSRAVLAVRESPRLLASVLASYGEAKFGEAADVLLEAADDRSPAVRTAARKAFMAYVTGPPPKAVGRSVRLLGGGTGRRAAYLTYRERAARAIIERIVSEVPELLEPPCEVRRENGSIDSACEGQPLRHTDVYFEWLVDERVRKQTERISAALGQPDPAQGVEALNRLLAEDPNPKGAEPIATFFAAQAERARAAGEPAEAGQLFRKASMLLRSTDENRASKYHRAALLAEADVPGLSRQGRDMLRHAALELGAAVQVPALPDEMAAEVSGSRGGLRAEPSAIGGRIALVTVLLFGLGIGFSPIRRRLLK